METLSVGQFARRAGVNVETVRYYERRGLLPRPVRRASGYRQYGGDAVTRMQFIKHAQTLGFSLDEISELLSLRVDPDTTCGDVKKRAEAKLEETEEKIRALQGMKRALTKLVASCRGRGPRGDCPILEAMEQPVKRRNGCK